MFGLAVLAHRPELDQVRVGHVVAHREQEVEVADDVGLLGLHRGLAGDHRVGRRGLLAVVDDRVGLGLGDHRVEELAVLDGADEAADAVAAECSSQAAMRASSSTIGVSESEPASPTQRRRAKLSTTETSWPRAEKRRAVGHPR